MINNVLYILSMENNPIPTFLMREAVLLVNYGARIHFGEDVYHESHPFFSGRRH